MPKYTTKKFIKKSKLIHQLRYDYSHVNYVNSQLMVKIICPKHGSFLQTPNNHLAGHGCAKCGWKIPRKLKTLGIDEFIRKSKLIHKNKYLYDKFIYINAHTKGILQCRLHGKFLQSPNNHLSGKGCYRCRKSRPTFTTEDFIKKASQCHKNKYDYTKTKYINYKHKVIISCPIHGEFLQTPSGHLNGRGCLKCFCSRRTFTIDEFKERAKIVHNSKYDYSKIFYINTTTHISIICPIHGIFSQTPNKHLSGRGCKKCGRENMRTGSVSKAETAFLDYMKIEKHNRNKYINGYYVDGIKNNTIYEFLGDYWHGNPNKFNHKKLNKSVKITFGSLYEKTFKRLNELKKGNFTVKYIWESDWYRFVKNPDSKLKILEL